MVVVQSPAVKPGFSLVVLSHSDATYVTHVDLCCVLADVEVEFLQQLSRVTSVTNGRDSSHGSMVIKFVS